MTVWGGGTSHVYVALGRRCVRNYGSDATVTAKHFRPLQPVYSRLDTEHIVGLTRTTTALTQCLQRPLYLLSG